MTKTPPRGHKLSFYTSMGDVRCPRGRVRCQHTSPKNEAWKRGLTGVFLRGWHVEAEPAYIRNPYGESLL